MKPKSWPDLLGVRDALPTAQGAIAFYRLERLERQGIGTIASLPYCLRVMLESVVRNCDGNMFPVEDVENLARWNPTAPASVEIPFQPRAWCCRTSPACRPWSI